MLAQSFMPAAELNITEAQKDALIKTLVLMETGKIVYTPIKDDAELDGEPKFTGHFSMVNWASTHECGTICCIGGTAELVGNVKFDWDPNSNELKELFYPCRVEDWADIDVSHAATALRSYLTVGKANWAAAMEVA